MRSLNAFPILLIAFLTVFGLGLAWGFSLHQGSYEENKSELEDIFGLPEGYLPDKTEDIPLINDEEISTFIEENADDFENRLPEFLSDMVSVTEQMAQQDLFAADFEPAQNFVNKWSAEFSSLTVDAVSQEFIEAFLLKVLEGTYYKYQASRNGGPLSHFFVMFQRLGRLNLGGLEKLFHWIGLDNQRRTLKVKEVVLEKTDAGVKSEEVYRRATTQELNGQVEFYELVMSDRVRGLKLRSQFRTVFHQALYEMYMNGIDDENTDFLTRFVELIDQKILAEYESGKMDETVFNYFWNPNHVVYERIVDEHPLLKGSHLGKHKVLDLYY